MPRSTVPTPPAPDAREATPLYNTLLEWVQVRLARRRYPLPVCKRLAWLVSGLAGTDAATLSEVGQTLHGLTITPAKEESIARRLLRLLQDERLDPPRVLADLFQTVLPELLQGLVAAHAANERSGARHHARFRPLRLIVDESSHTDQVHLLVIGLAYQGIVLPLGVRVWTQNLPLPGGEYWTQLGSLLWEIHRILPPVLRDHVELVADRAYAVPRLLDLLRALEWDWVLRAQGQIVVRFGDGTEQSLRELVTRPGQLWLGETTDAATGAAARPLEVFKTAGGRISYVLAVWAEGQAEPWLLLTSRPARRARAATYAQRWAIERLFLSWKSHGWDLERCGVHDAPRLGRLLSGLVLATLWRLVWAIPVAQAHLADLTHRAEARSLPSGQLSLPFAELLTDPDRPWAAKRSLLTWGAVVAHRIPLATTTPSACWNWPDWEALPWSQQCAQAYAGAA
jgi:hypothetical protein